MKSSNKIGTRTKKKMPSLKAALQMLLNDHGKG